MTRREGSLRFAGPGVVVGADGLIVAAGGDGADGGADDVAVTGGGTVTGGAAGGSAPQPASRTSPATKQGDSKDSVFTAPIFPLRGRDRAPLADCCQPGTTRRLRTSDPARSQTRTLAVCVRQAVVEDAVGRCLCHAQPSHRDQV